MDLRREINLAKRPCPVCRKHVLRIPAHMAAIHHNIPNSEVITLSEHARKFRCGNVCVNINDLYKRFPSCPLDVARLLVELHIPVFRRTGSDRDMVHHYTVAELSNTEGSAKSADGATSTAEVREVSVGGLTATVIRTPLDFDQSSAKITKSGNPAAHIAYDRHLSAGGPTSSVTRAPPGFKNRVPSKSGTLSVLPVPVQSESVVLETANNDTRESAASHVVLPLDSGLDLLNRHEPTVSHQSDNTDDDAQITSPLRKSPRVKRRKILCSSPVSAIAPPAKRKRVVVSSSSESDSDEEISSGSALARIALAYKDANMYVHPSKIPVLVERNRYVKAFKDEIESSNPDGSQTESHLITNELSLCCKIIKFCAPMNDIEQFTWDSFTAERMTSLSNVLRHQIKLSGSTLINYYNCAKKLVNLGLRSDEGHGLSSARSRIVELSAAASKALENYEAQFAENFAAFDKVKPSSMHLFNKAQVITGPSTNTLAIMKPLVTTEGTDTPALKSESSSTSGTDIDPWATSETERLKVLVNSMHITASGSIPGFKDFRRQLLNMPHLRLEINPKVTKALNGMAYHRRMFMRAEQLAHNLRRNLSAPDLRSRIETTLREYDWLSKKQMDACMSVCKKYKSTQAKEFRSVEEDRNN